MRARISGGEILAERRIAIGAEEAMLASQNGGGQLAFIRWVHNREGHTENKTGGSKQQSTAAAASDIDTSEEQVVLTAK